MQFVIFSKLNLYYLNNLKIKFKKGSFKMNVYEIVQQNILKKLEDAIKNNLDFQ